MCFCQVHQALFPAEELEALVQEFRRNEEMQEKEEDRVALKRQQFEDSLVGVMNVYMFLAEAWIASAVIYACTTVWFVCVFSLGYSTAPE